jgi:predicted SAM-dependent methyltransferase
VEGQVKVNLGSGLTVAPGWINVDASLNAFFAGAPVQVLKLSYRMTGSRNYYSETDYINHLRSNQFVHHDLSRSLPFQDASADFCYCSHFLEHLYADRAVQLMREVLRVLKPAGVFRIGVPDLAYAVGLYQAGDKQRFLQYFFLGSNEPDLARHRYMYDYEGLASKLAEVGYVGIERRRFREGAVPDLDLLDNRPDETLFVEASRRS